MIKKQLLFLLLLTVGVSFSQTKKEKDSIYHLKGQVISTEDKKPLSRAHLFNLNTVIGTTTNDNGEFSLATKPNDTIYVSYLGYQSIKLRISNDLLKGNELVIELHEKKEELEEVVVKSHKLIGVLEVDVKSIPKDKYARIHIQGLTQTYEIGVRRSSGYNSPIDALFKPIDFMYNRFGKKPKQLKKLKKLRDEDKLRQLLKSKFNRELMMEYLDMNSEELANLLNECNYSDYFIKQASDLQLIEAVLLCYENYKALKKGSTKRKK